MYSNTHSVCNTLSHTCCSQEVAAEQNVAAPASTLGCSRYRCRPNIPDAQQQNGDVAPRNKDVVYAYTIHMYKYISISYIYR